MSLKNRNGPNHKAIVAARRRLVASLYLKGLTQREVEAALPKQAYDRHPDTGQLIPRLGAINFETDSPWSIGTINADLKALRKEWQQSAARDIATLKAQQLAEIAEVKLAAWKKNSVKTVLAALDREMKLTGTAASEKLELTVTAEMERIITALIENLEGEALDKALAAIEALR